MGERGVSFGVRHFGSCAFIVGRVCYGRESPRDSSWDRHRCMYFESSLPIHRQEETASGWIERQKHLKVEGEVGGSKKRSSGDEDG